MWLINLLITFLLFMLGASLASFLAVLAYRLPRKMSWVRSRSICDHCHRQLTWYENIPVFSYLFLGGRCRICRKRIPKLYFWWEVVGGLFFCWWVQFFVLVGELWWSTLFWLILGEILIFVAFVDLQKRYVTTFWLTILFLWSAIYLACSLIWGDFTWQVVAVRLLVAFLLWLLFVAIDKLAKLFWRVNVALGSGDAFLIAILALWLPPAWSLIMLLLAFWSGALVGVGLLLRKRFFHRGDGKIAFIPFLVLGFWGAISYGDLLINLFWS
ncbi:MAG: prepilin peptidase [bacterium]|nr:prepilin peptidase [bacterium]